MEVLASASDKKFLRTNLTDGLKESLKLNQLNLPLLGRKEVKIFEVGTVFKKDKEEVHVAFTEKKEVKEMSLEDFMGMPKENSESGRVHPEGGGMLQNSPSVVPFKMWSLFPFIARDVAVWVPENVSSSEVENIIKNNMGDLVVRGPELFDEFKKDGKVSYAFRLVFQAEDRTLTDQEINEIMLKITDKIKENEGWQVR